MRANDDMFARALFVMERYLAAHATEIAAPGAFESRDASADITSGTGLYRLDYPGAGLSQNMWFEAKNRRFIPHIERVECNNPFLAKLDESMPGSRRNWEVSFSEEAGFVSWNLADRLYEYVRLYGAANPERVASCMIGKGKPKYYDFLSQVASDIYWMDARRRCDGVSYSAVRTPGDMIARIAIARHIRESLDWLRDSVGILRRMDFCLPCDFGTIICFGSEVFRFESLFSYSSLSEHGLDWWSRMVALTWDLLDVWSNIALYGDEIHMFETKLLDVPERLRKSNWDEWIAFGEANGYDLMIQAVLDGVPAKDVLA